MGKQWLTLFFWAPKLLRMVIAAMKLKDAYSLEEVMTNLDNLFKSNKVKAMVFSSSHVWMCELDYKESRVQKN